MKRNVRIVTAALTLLAGVASAVRAAEYSGHTVKAYNTEVCWRTRVRPYCPPAVVVPSSSTIYNKNEINVYSRVAPLPYRPYRYSRTPNPLVHVPVSGQDVEVGSTSTLKMNFLCTEPGQVFLIVGNTSHACQLVNWTPSEVTFVLPNMSVPQHGTAAELQVWRSNGTGMAGSKPIRLVNAPDLIVHDEPEAGSAAGQVSAVYPVATSSGLVLNAAAN